MLNGAKKKFQISFFQGKEAIQIALNPIFGKETLANPTEILSAFHIFKLLAAGNKIVRCIINFCNKW